MEKVISDKLELICRIICQTVPAEAIYLFGSYAYGTPHEDSDLDLYVVVPDDGPRPLLAMQDIRYALFMKQDMPLDILVGRSGEFARRQDLPGIERTVSQKGVLLFERQPAHEKRMA